MKLLITSVIPIELVTLARRRKCIEKLRADGVIGARDESPRSKFIKELGSPDCEAYAITASSPAVCKEKRDGARGRRGVGGADCFLGYFRLRSQPCGFLVRPASRPWPALS